MNANNIYYYCIVCYIHILLILFYLNFVIRDIMQYAALITTIGKNNVYLFSGCVFRALKM